MSEGQCMKCQKNPSVKTVESYFGKLIIGKKGNYFEDVTEKKVSVCKSCITKSRISVIIEALLFPIVLWLFYLSSKIFNFFTPDDLRDVNSHALKIEVLGRTLLAWVIENALYVLPVLTLFAFFLSLYGGDPWPEILDNIFKKEGLRNISKEDYIKYSKDK